MNTMRTIKERNSLDDKEIEKMSYELDNMKSNCEDNQLWKFIQYEVVNDWVVQFIFFDLVRDLYSKYIISKSIRKYKKLELFYKKYNEKFKN